jgi:hypothetical protein
MTRVVSHLPRVVDQSVKTFAIVVGVWQVCDETEAKSGAAPVRTFAGRCDGASCSRYAELTVVGRRIHFRDVIAPVGRGRGIEYGSAAIVCLGSESPLRSVPEQTLNEPLLTARVDID